MFKFYSKTFTDPDKIDKWLNGFYKDEPMANYNYEVIGYVSVGSAVMITLKVWESQKVDLTKLPKRGDK